MSNPYTLVFGQPPNEIIERVPQVERIVSEFTSARPSNYINLVTGIRGSGKTVFITEVSNRLRSEKNWIIVDLNPQRDLLTSLASRLGSRSGLMSIFKDAKIDLNVLGVGVGIGGTAGAVDEEELLLGMLRALKKKNKKLLITIDEATNSKSMRVFASSYQIFLREKLPIFLLTTGLPKDLDRLKNAEGMTFLERAPRTVLGPLKQSLIADNYMRILNLEQDKAIEVAKRTRGYSFAFQVIGYFMWQQKDVDKAYEESKDYLYEFAYNKIWSELSRKDREVVLAVAEAPTDKVADIREMIGYSNNQFNPYRDRLIKAGVITSEREGHVEIALPFFEEYAKTKQ